MSRNEKGRQIANALKKLAASSKKLSINELRIIVGLERAIARIQAVSSLKNHIVYKGGFVLLKTLEFPRFTRDLDTLAVNISQDSIVKLITAALETDLDDGLWFGDIGSEELMFEEKYRGLRFDFAFAIGDPPGEKIHKLSRLHIDIAFGDTVITAPVPESLRPIIQELSPISWRIYPLEFIFSEKLQTMIDRGSANTRAKDIFDLPAIIENCERPSLVEAIKSTFQNRNTPIPTSFLKTISSFDTTLLRAAWRTVQISEINQDFDSAWKNLLKTLQEIDSILK